MMLESRLLRQTLSSSNEAVVAYMVVAISRLRQKALANCIRLGVRHSASKIAGDPTNTQSALAREVATFSRFPLYKNSMPRGASK
jgi:hypothetical protein